MIEKLFVLIDNKLTLSKFNINKNNNIITINSLDHFGLIKIPIYNKFNGIDYYPMYFPLEMPIYDNQVFNPYIILSSYNLNIENDIDFFYNIGITINKFNLSFFNFNTFLDENNNQFIKILNEHYIKYISFSILKEIDDFNLFIRNLWLCINLNKLICIYILIKYPNLTNKNIKLLTTKYNISKKYLTLIAQIKSIKYNITASLNEHTMTLPEYYYFNYNNSLKITDLKVNNCYYIIINRVELLESTQSAVAKSEIPDIMQNKIIKIFVSKINKNNIINIDNVKNIIFNNYKWYYYHPNITIDKLYIIYQTFMNKIFTYNILKNIINIDEIHATKILDYYLIDAKLSNLISLKIFEKYQEYLDDFNILKLNSFSNAYFEYITKKYSDDQVKIYEILTILFKNYNYPLKNNRHEFDNLFDYILYFSLYNYKNIFVNNLFSIEPFNNIIIPNKVKSLYINLLKAIIQIINNNFEAITYNQKFYFDYLHRNIIKILLSDFIITNKNIIKPTNYSKLSIKLLREIISSDAYKKLKNIFHTNILLIDIGNKLTWNNLPKKLNYLNIFYKNNEIVYYQDKLNRNIIPENFDYRIKKIIENPFDMYKYLRKEKDFIKWSNFISDKIIQLYNVPISLSSEDFNNIGYLIYLLYNINEQNPKEQSYLKFINFCNSHHKLILDANRINIKIKEHFPTIKCNLNLGYLAKHLTWDKEVIILDELKQEKTADILKLEKKLGIITQKYHKYKTKYLESKNSNSIDKTKISETSNATVLSKDKTTM